MTDFFNLNLGNYLVQVDFSEENNLRSYKVEFQVILFFVGIKIFNLNAGISVFRLISARK